jgi:hypothetical protein
MIEPVSYVSIEQSRSFGGFDVVVFKRGNLSNAVVVYSDDDRSKCEIIGEAYIKVGYYWLVSHPDSPAA